MDSEYRYRFGPFLLDPRRRLLWRDQQRIPLYGKAFETLLALVQNAERVVEKEELLSEIWAGRVVEENNLSQSISAVRKALGDTAQTHIYVVTIPGCGYRFAAPVSAVREPAQTPDAEVAHSPEPLIVLRRGGGRLAWALLGTAAVLLLVGLLRSRFGPTIFAQNRLKMSSSVPLQARRSVAILGFQNLSGQKGDAWLSTALAEMLHTELAAGEHLHVFSQVEVTKAKTEQVLTDRGAPFETEVPEIGRRLGSDFLVSGSYSLVGEKGTKQVRFDVCLQSTKSGETIAEFAETGTQTELYGLVSQAGRHLRQELGISELSPSETLAARAAAPKDSDATRFYAEGLARLRMFDAIGAKGLLQKATVLEPDYALAHSALADAWAWLGYNHNERDEAEKAFQLSGNLSRQDQLSVEGEYRMATRDWARAVQVYRTLSDLFPDELDYGLNLALAQTAASAPNDALATLNALRHLPSPVGKDPRIDFEEFDAWRSVGDFKHMETALTATTNRALETGALLLLARARTRRCWVRRAVAEPQRALDDCRAAQKIYVAAGDRRGQAEVLRLLGDVVAASDIQSAMRNYEQALVIERDIGHLSGEASAISRLATQYANRGDHTAAKNSYERALAIFRQLDDRGNASGGMVNLGLELAALGKTAQALQMYQDALAAAAGNKYIEALAEYNIGSLLQLQGDLQGAQKSYQQALEWFVEMGNKEYDMTAVRSLVELATVRDDFAGAHKLYEQALAMRQGSQEDTSTAQRDMAGIELSLEEGRVPTDGEVSLRRMLQVFHNSNQPGDEAQATALLARYLLLKDRPSEALETITHAAEIASRAEPNIRLTIQVEDTRIRLASGPHDTQTRALHRLSLAIAQAREFHYLSVELEGRLTLAEGELRFGAAARGRAQLEAVAKEASKHGFMLLARKAKTVA